MIAKHFLANTFETRMVAISGMVCLSIFGGGVVTYVCLVSPIDSY
jgi:hypothetical protein